MSVAYHDCAYLCLCRHKEIAEQRYLGLFQFIDLTKDFFFSYSYDLTRTLQHNMIAAAPICQRGPNQRPKEMYAWNFRMMEEFVASIGWASASAWMLVLTHGAFVQRKCSIFGRNLNIALVARRSRHFAGTRYLKRGVNDAGMVANDVEVEQIMIEDVADGAYSSFVQVRGSIPTFWTQETSVTMPKPPIVLNRLDPTYTATRMHFADLYRRYSAPVLILDLTKQTERRERELIVSHEFRRAIEHINHDCHDSSHNQCSSDFYSNKPVVDLSRLRASQLQTSRVRKVAARDSWLRLRYCALDFSQVSKHRHLNILEALDDLAKWACCQTRLFCSRLGPPPEAAMCPSDDACYEARKGKNYSSHVEQEGVLRTNCIDCLDRTNVAQFTVGAHALGRVLAITGLCMCTMAILITRALPNRCTADIESRTWKSGLLGSDGTVFYGWRPNFTPIRRLRSSQKNGNLATSG